MNIVPMRPIDNDVVAAVAEAARLIRGKQDDYPILMLHARARVVTFAAMREVFPKLHWRELGRLLEAEDIDALPRHLSAARRQDWWNDAFVDEIVGLLVRDYYGERAL